MSLKDVVNALLLGFFVLEDDHSGRLDRDAERKADISILLDIMLAVVLYKICERNAAAA